MYSNLSAGDFAGNKKDDKSISEWLKIKGYDLLKIRAQKIFWLDFRCTEKYFNRLISEHNLKKIK